MEYQNIFRIWLGGQCWCKTIAVRELRSLVLILILNIPSGLSMKARIFIILGWRSTMNGDAHHHDSDKSIVRTRVALDR